MRKLNNETCEMTFEELEQVSGGDMLNRLIDKTMAALGARLMDAIHKPLVSPTPISLHMR